MRHHGDAHHPGHPEPHHHWRDQRRVLVTGGAGFLGSHLCDRLLRDGHDVLCVDNFYTGTKRNIAHLLGHPRFEVLRHDVTFPLYVEVDEIYNLAAQSHVQVSFETAEYTANADGLGTLRLLEAIRLLKLTERTRFYQASTSEMYGKVRECPQSETTPFYPRSPYAAAKLYAYWITVNYREAYSMHASNGILFNHESPLRGETFVTRKITRAVAAIELGRQDCLYLGNIDSARDWGHARDYAAGMWAMLQQDTPDDYVLATGESRTVREFVEHAFAETGREIVWSGKGAAETGTDRKSGRVVVRIDPRYFRPAEVDRLQGDAGKARRKLDWKPETTFQALVTEMVAEDLKAMETLLRIVEVVRSIRGEYTLPPSQSTDLIFSADEPALRNLLAAHGDILGNLDKVIVKKVEANAAKPAFSAAGIVPGGRVFIPLEGILDPAQEKVRLTKELGKAEGFLVAQEKKLSNEGFVKSAPAEVVEELA